VSRYFNMDICRNEMKYELPYALRILVEPEAVQNILEIHRGVEELDLQIFSETQISRQKATFQCCSPWSSAKYVDAYPAQCGCHLQEFGDDTVRP
jgi:hypothetical protein